MKLSYIAIRVIDLDVSLKFYTEDLGFKVVEKRTPIPGEQVVAMVDEGSRQKLTLMHYAEDCKMYTPWKQDGVELDHLLFEVDDAKKKFDEMVEKGAPVAFDLMERDTEEGHMAYGMIKDPNGIWIGFRSLTKK